jgi:hypothetical protein
MIHPPILQADPLDWTYDELASELEALALLEDLELPAGASLADLTAMVVDEDLRRVTEELETVARLEAR